MAPPKDVGKNMFEILPRDVVLRIAESLTLRERARLTSVCKKWSIGALKDWPCVDIDYGYITPIQAPLVLNFLNRLGLHSQGTLESLTFPMEVPPDTFLPGLLHYRRFNSLESLDFGIGTQSGWHSWTLYPNEVKQMTSLKNLKSLKATFSELQVGTIVTLDAFAGLPQLSNLELKVIGNISYKGGQDVTIDLSQTLEVLSQLKSLRIDETDVKFSNTLQRLAQRVTNLHMAINNRDKKHLDVPQLVIGSMMSPWTSPGSLYHSLQATHKLKHLRLDCELLNQLDAELLPALTHLEWTERIGPQTQLITEIASRAAVPQIMKLSLGALDPEDRNSLFEINRMYPRLEYLRIFDLIGSEFGSNFFKAVSMPKLRELALKFNRQHPPSEVTLLSVGLDEQQLPSLTYLELSPCMFEKHLDHKMLQTLKIVSTLQHDDVPAVLLGQLPSLKTLHLTLNVHKTKDVMALAQGLQCIGSLEDVCVMNLDKDNYEVFSIAEAVFWAARSWVKIQRLEFVEKHAIVTLERECMKRLRHLGIVCKALDIQESCRPLPVKSFCFQTEKLDSDTSTISSLAGCNGAVVKEPWIYDKDISSRPKPPAHQVMQAYRHDRDLPYKDWMPISEELKSIMKIRLQHV